MYITGRFLNVVPHMRTDVPAAFVCVFMFELWICFGRKFEMGAIARACYCIRIDGLPRPFTCHCISGIARLLLSYVAP